MISKNKTIFLSVWGLCALLWAGIAQALIPLPLDEVASDLRQRLNGDPPPKLLRVGDITLHSPALLSDFYTQRNYQAAWLNGNSPVSGADALLKTVIAAQQEGLQPRDYHAGDLINALLAVRHMDMPTAPRLADLELLLSDAFLTYGSHLLGARLSEWKLEDRDWALKPRSRDLVAILQEALNGNGISEALNALLPPHAGYARLRDALASYREIAWDGGWPTVDRGPNLEEGERDPRVRQLRTRLRITGDLAEPPAGDEQAETFFDRALAQAVRRFQRRHGLAEDGIVGPQTLAALNVPVQERLRQIELNMERWRWLPEDLGRRHIVINIPSFELKVVEEGKQVLDARIVVGRSVRPTPVFSDTMSYLVFSPSWNVPRSIAVEEKLPQLRKDPHALTRQNFRVFDLRDGRREIDPASVDWQTFNEHNFPFFLRQDPGPDNALGRVKFMFPNRFSVYVHDTPASHLFRRSQRTFSFGCIRISKPFELAEYLLRDDPRWSRDAIITAAHGERERTVRLPEKIPIHILYWTAWVDEDGTVHFRNDVYERDQPMLVALNLTGD